MFMLQALDQVCRLKSDNDSLSVTVEAPWVTRRLGLKHRQWTALLGWKLTYRSVNERVSSVNSQAIRGHIGMRLPSAKNRGA